MATDRETRVLIVDDLRVMTKIVRVLLAQVGFRDIDEASSGAEALEMLQARRYGLVISDWNMDGMNGLEFLRRVRALAQLKTTPFIMVSGEARAEFVIAAKKAGVDGYIVKPFSAETLRAKIDEAMLFQGAHLATD